VSLVVSCPHSAVRPAVLSKPCTGVRFVLCGTVCFVERSITLFFSLVFPPPPPLFERFVKSSRPVVCNCSRFTCLLEVVVAAVDVPSHVTVHRCLFRKGFLSTHTLTSFSWR
ncbi:unnamed protein product, partial [Ectocarpus sp. 8 AP-2014]